MRRACVFLVCKTGPVIWVSTDMHMGIITACMLTGGQSSRGARAAARNWNGPPGHSAVMLARGKNATGLLCSWLISNSDVIIKVKC